VDVIIRDLNLINKDGLDSCAVSVLGQTRLAVRACRGRCRPAELFPQYRHFFSRPAP
jgi:hypothetical protein